MTLNKNSLEGQERPTRPELNEVARIVNSLFLDSEYQGKDWESVRKELIKQLTEWRDQDRKNNQHIDRGPGFTHSDPECPCREGPK